MNQKQLTILGVLGLALAVIGLVVSKSKQREYKSTNVENIAKVLPGFPINDVTKLKIKDSASETTLEKIDGVWTIRERDNYPASYTEVGEFLRLIWDLKPTKKEQVGESQFERIEVVVPGEEAKDGTGIAVEFTDKSGESAGQIVLGKQIMREGQANPMFGGAGGGEYPVGRYVRTLGDDGGIFLVNEGFQTIHADAPSWLDRAFLKVTKPKSIQVTYLSDEEGGWHLTRETDTGDWSLVNAGADEVIAKTKTTSLNSVLSSPSFGDVNRETFEPEFEAEIATFEGFTYRLKVGAKSDEEKRLVQVGVVGSFAESREAAEDETDEQKAEKDKEFTDKQAELKKKLATEKAFESWTYSVSNWTFTSLEKKRADLLEVPAVPEPTEDAASISTGGLDFLSGEGIDPLTPIIETE